MKRRAAIVVAILVPLVVAGFFGWRLIGSTTPASARPTVCQANCHYVGVALTFMSQDHLTQFEHATGIKPGIVENYESFGQPFPSSWAGTLLARGILPIIQLQPRRVPLADIAAGKYDSYLSQYAAAARALGGPVGLSFGHEMNGAWYSWGYTNTPARVFVAAWRHIHQVFAAVGARKIIWVWTAARLTPQDRRVAPWLSPWWPGGQYVDWVGLDIYYFTPQVTFRQVFLPTITAVRKFTHDPILLTETAVYNQPGQVRQIDNLFAGAQASGLLGIVWYNQDALHTWQLNRGRHAAIAAFRRGTAGMLASR